MADPEDFSIVEPDALRIYDGVAYIALDKPYYRVFKPLLACGFVPSECLRKTSFRVFSDRTTVHLVRPDDVRIDLCANVICHAQASTLEFGSATVKTWAEYHSLDAVDDPSLVFRFSVVAERTGKVFAEAKDPADTQPDKNIKRFYFSRTLDVAHHDEAALESVYTALRAWIG